MDPANFHYHPSKEGQLEGSRKEIFQESVTSSQWSKTPPLGKENNSMKTGKAYSKEKPLVQVFPKRYPATIANFNYTVAAFNTSPIAATHSLMLCFDRKITNNKEKWSKY